MSKNNKYFNDSEDYNEYIDFSEGARDREKRRREERKNNNKVKNKNYRNNYFDDEFDDSYTRHKKKR